MDEKETVAVKFFQNKLMVLRDVRPGSVECFISFVDPDGKDKLVEKAQQSESSVEINSSRKEKKMNVVRRDR